MGRIVLLLLIAAAGAASLGSCGTDNTPIVGDVINNALNSFDTTATTAEQGGDVVVADAAANAQATAQNVLAQLDTDLTKHIDQLNSITQTAIQNLENLEATLNSNAQGLVATVTRDGQQIVNEIPLTNKNPQVTSYTPAYAVTGSSGTVHVLLSGNFVYAYQQHQKPTLVVNGVSYQPEDVTTQGLGFAIPGGDFVTLGESVGAVTLDLDIKYQTGVIFKSYHPGQFELLVLVLPPKPLQSAVLTTPVTSTTTATQTRIVPAGAGPGGTNAGGNSFDCNDHDWPVTFHPDQGWQIQPSSAQPTIVREKNASNVALTIDDVNTSGGTIQYTTHSACFAGICNGCGEVYFYVTYDEEQQETTTTTQTIPIDLGWGDQIVEPVAGSWLLQVTLFNGERLQCGAGTPCRDPHGYITGSYNGTNLTVNTIDPTTLFGG